MPSASSPSTRLPARRSTKVWSIVIASLVVVALAIVGWLMWGPSGATEAQERVLDDSTEMGELTLVADDLDVMREYYVDAIGLDVITEDESALALGRDGAVVLRIEASDGVPPAAPTDAGLYHTAILFSDAPALAASLQSVAEKAPASYQGAADHAVSLAFYFGDPEGNGVELYVDRPRDEWVWNDGEVQMGSDPLDPNQFMAEHGGQDSSDTLTLGHVHLKVGSTDEAKAFYVDVLGFDVTSEANGAVFMSAGGYHHHLAANTWNSAGAGERNETLGLREFTVVVPTEARIDEVRDRLTEAGIALTVDDADSVAADDPWGNSVRFTVAG